MGEEWVELEDWPDYLISNLGAVWSKRRGRKLKQSLDRMGYPSVGLQQADVWRRVSVHRLVAFGFVEGYFEGAFVNHIDGDKTNNKHFNLEWVTHEENMRHAREIGLIPGHGSRRLN